MDVVGKAKAADMPLVGVEPEPELPSLLWQIGELEQASNLCRDWHEQTDPVWGKLYYVNRWSGQVIHNFGAGGVFSVAVRLTVWFSNIRLSNLKVPEIEVIKQAQMRAGPADVMPGDYEAALERLVNRIHQDLREPFCSLADVPVDMMETIMIDGENDAVGEDGGLKKAMNGDDLPPFRIQCTITAPGSHAAWAANGIKEDMANGEYFNTLMMGILAQVPELQRMKDVMKDPIVLAQATLDETDVAPWEKPPTPPPPENPPPAVDPEFVELRKNIRYFKPKILDMKACKAFNLVSQGLAPGDLRALAEGLDLAARDHKPFIEEIHFWELNINDFQAVCFRQAFERGRLEKLHTLLLDANKIGAVGAQALGDGL